MEKDAILKHWVEYIGGQHLWGHQMFEDTRAEKPEINKDMAGPIILNDEIRNALKSMKNGRAVGPDNISI